MTNAVNPAIVWFVKIGTNYGYAMAISPDESFLLAGAQDSDSKCRLVKINATNGLIISSNKT